ncbi:hypothetical protein D9M73_126600 [compost metagenome]
MDKDVETTERSDRLLYRRLDCGRIGGVGKDRLAGPPVRGDCGDGGLCGGLIAGIGDDDIGTVRRQPLGDRRADTARATGDDGLLTREIHAVRSCARDHDVCAVGRFTSGTDVQ